MVAEAEAFVLDGACICVFTAGDPNKKEEERVVWLRRRHRSPLVVDVVYTFAAVSLVLQSYCLSCIRLNQ